MTHQIILDVDTGKDDALALTFDVDVDADAVMELFLRTVTG